LPGRLIKTFFIFIALAIALAGSGTAVSQPVFEVSHSVSFPRLNQQYIHIRSEFPVAGEVATIKMANWTPGSYMIRDFANNLDRIEFFNDSGEPLSFEKTSKNTWQVVLSGATSIIAEYDVHAGDLSVRTSWASPEYVLINGASVFLYSDASREMPHRLSVEAPSAFDTISSPMTSTGQNGSYLASGFDELVDSPIVISGDMAHHFSDGPHNFWLLNVGETELWNGLESARDLRVLVVATNRFWGTVPFEKPYWFFNFLVEQGGGLEHDYSTVIMGSRWQMLDREDYIKWLSLAAHEYFHVWNVRRMRPAGLSKYDYENEQYSGALW
jgi:predicted metalloprotease with PDZ domain